MKPRYRWCHSFKVWIFWEGPLRFGSLLRPARMAKPDNSRW